MQETDEAKNILTKAMEVIESMAKRENHAERMTKISADAAKQYEELANKIKNAQAHLVSLEANKKELLLDASRKASDILAVAQETQNKLDQKLEDAKKLEQKAQESLVLAENSRLAHEGALNEVLAQKEKLRAALAG